MPIEVRPRLAGDEAAAVARLLDAAVEVDGRHPLSERKWRDLVGGGPEGLAAVVATDGAGQPIGFAQVSGHPGEWGVELVVHPEHRDAAAEIAPDLLDAARDAVAAAGGGELHLWVTDAGADVDAVAAGAGLGPGRELHQLRRPLPVDEPFELETRAFVPGQDEQAWLGVNNRAFATHPEQGGWTLDTLLAREREPWFDAAGFLLHDRDGRLAGFCWTKVHAEHDPALGEIYVIGVDPDFQGQGIGRPLVLAGLDALARRGVPVGMLYVEGDNRSAMRLYRQLGFEPHHVDRTYVIEVPAAQPTD